MSALGAWDVLPSSHHWPDVRQGPADYLHAPARHAAAIGGDAHRPALLHGDARGNREPEPPQGHRGRCPVALWPSGRRDAPACRGARWSYPARRAPPHTRRAANCPPRAGAPHRPSPISAFSRAISVAICSGIGTARVSSECCSTRAGVGSAATVTRSMPAAGGLRFERQQRDRAQRLGIAHRRRQLQRLLVHGLVHQVQAHVQHGHAAIPAFEVRGQRLDQAPEHERQRLEALDRPFQIERLLEPLLRQRGHQRLVVFARARCATSGHRPPPAAPPRRRAAAPPARPACADPSGAACARGPDPRRTRSASAVVPSGGGITSSSSSMGTSATAAVSASGGRTVAGVDHREAGAMPHQQARGHARAGNGHAHAQLAVGRRAANLRAQSPARRRTGASAHRRRAPPRVAGALRDAGKTRAPRPPARRRRCPRPRKPPQTSRPQHAARGMYSGARSSRTAAPTRSWPSTRRRGDTTRTSTSLPATRRLRSGCPDQVVRPVSDSVIAAGAARHRLGRQQHARRVAALHGALHAQPGGERDALQGDARRVGQVQRHDAEPARLQHQVERLQRAVDGALHQALGGARIARSGPRLRQAPIEDRRPIRSSTQPARAPTARATGPRRPPPATPRPADRRCR